jgi:putative copper export protein
VEISPGLGILIMMNNYFHDVATALLAAGAYTLWVLTRVHDGHSDPQASAFFVAACRRLTLLVKIALSWIIMGGIPRTIFYQDFEWANAAGKGQIPALIVKHLLIAVMLGAGAYGWLRLRQRLRTARAVTQESESESTAPQSPLQ